MLRELIRDARLSMSELGTRVHLSRAHVYQRVEALRAAGLLRGFSADIDPQLAGLAVGAFVLLQTHQDRWRDRQSTCSTS